MIWKVIAGNLANNSDFFKFDNFLQKLIHSIKCSESFRDPELRYLPKEEFVGCVMNVFYEMYWPTIKNINKWERSLQDTFQQLKTIVAMHMGLFKTKEARTMLILL